MSRNEKKGKLRTSNDIYDRLKWDEQLAKDEYFVGYVDRFRGVLEIPFADFIPGGDIPFHRVYYFRTNEGYVWDRETRLDLLFHSGEPNSLRNPEFM